MREALERADIRRHVVTLLAIATRHGPHQFPVFKGQAHGHAVDLGFDGVIQLFAAEKFGQPGVEFAQLALVVSVVEGGHRLTVTHADETLGAVIADALGRRFAASRFRMRRLEVGQFSF